MAASAHFLAFDLGAESGRAMLGRLRAGVLDVSEIHRFVNEPVRQNGSLHWDVLRLWLEMKRGMERAAATPIESVGVDAWGCDYALVGEQGVLLQNPYHYRDKRTDGVMDAVFERVTADADLRRHRHPVPAVQHALSVVRRLPRDAAPHRRGDDRSGRFPIC